MVQIETTVGEINVHDELMYIIENLEYPDMFKVQKQMYGSHTTHSEPRVVIVYLNPKHVVSVRDLSNENVIY